jgi:hypothetical protein
MIRHQNNKWVVLSEDGSKELGSYETKQEAMKRLQQIEYFKHKGATKPRKKQLGEHR